MAVDPPSPARALGLWLLFTAGLLVVVMPTQLGTLVKDRPRTDQGPTKGRPGADRGQTGGGPPVGLAGLGLVSGASGVHIFGGSSGAAVGDEPTPGRSSDHQENRVNLSIGGEEPAVVEDDQAVAELASALLGVVGDNVRGAAARVVGGRAVGEVDAHSRSFLGFGSRWGRLPRGAASRQMPPRCLRHCPPTGRRRGATLVPAQPACSAADVARVEVGR